MKILFAERDFQSRKKSRRILEWRKSCRILYVI